MKQSAGLFSQYQVTPGTLDEAFTDFPSAYSEYDRVRKTFDDFLPEDFKKLNENAKLSFLNQGITYAVYSEDGGGTEKVFPFDLFPRIIAAEEWQRLELGLRQRNLALNRFLTDVYGRGQILQDKVVPTEIVKSSNHFVKEMVGFKPPAGIYIHISGTDLVRHTDGNFYVLEDNLRNPSGVSYVLSNRQVMRRTLYDLFDQTMVEDVSNYPDMLHATLRSVAPEPEPDPCCVLLTPGQYNSAYYEHSLLAHRMGIDLVQGDDMFVEDDMVFLKNIDGPRRVNVIYRRIDDDFLDPEVFRKDSLLGVPGLMGAYLKGRVTIVNAPGTGIADDKAICAFVPDMIKYYLNEDPIIQNVQTYICSRPKELAHVLDNLATLVIKPVDMSGGYGVLIGDQLSKKELATAAAAIKANPRNFIAQPKIMLSTHGTYFDGEGFSPRHIDLRTFTLMGGEQEGISDGMRILRGGLTRVALRQGSLIVNSSQGGGSKDTWVIAEQKQANQPPAPGGLEFQTQPGGATFGQSQSQ